MTLSEVQKDIITTKGNVVVRASAGTGKTLTLVEKIAKELDENHTHRSIAAITFTIKAAKEIKDRVSVDTTHQFIGTNNSFAIEEIIKPFMKDVFGDEYDLDLNTDYSIRVSDFKEGLKKIHTAQTLCTYQNNQNNFIFQLAYRIVTESVACKLYLQSKYFKLYIDEYQDCDRDMHKLFMFICNELSIETFIVGDEKQSIYQWRGAHPEAFISVCSNPNFGCKFLSDNFRSCKQIQNYSNLLCKETSHLYSKTETLDSIIWLNTGSVKWASDVLNLLDSSKGFALLRFRRADAENGSILFKQLGIDCEYIPPTPISDITTNAAWIYQAIAKFFILEKYSVYDLIDNMPSEGSTDKNNISKLKSFLKKIGTCIEHKNQDAFLVEMNNIADYLGYIFLTDHVNCLYQTITDTNFHSAFEPEKYKNVAITFHSSKGLEFDQVILFCEDYRLDNMSSIYNHYVSSTRAKFKLILVYLDERDDRIFADNLSQIFQKSNLTIPDLLEFK